MKRKTAGRWGRLPRGKLHLEEVELDEGPSYAAGISRGAGRGNGSQHRRRAAPLERKPPVGLGIPKSQRPMRPIRDPEKAGHPADNPKERARWERAVQMR